MALLFAVIYAIVLQRVTDGPLTIFYVRRLGAIMAMAAYENKTERDVIFDTNSKPVGIDNHASAYISGNIDDFVGELKETN